MEVKFYIGLSLVKSGLGTKMGPSFGISNK